ncbi:Abi family protein [Bifidobacterium thermophilum]|uniref:Abi family protein n=1 Tax=Bifidobacterium thermophilum TaxID=33905 RepID=UPI003F9181C3
MYKPFKSIDDQIALLESRGVICDRDTRTILMREGYYSIVNGYKDPFLDPTATVRAGDDRYLPGTRFDDILHLFNFDRQLRITVFKSLILAEAVLRTTCAYCFSQLHQDEANAYQQSRNLNQPTNTEHDIVTPLINQIEKIISKGARDPREGGKGYIRHCVLDHDSEVPLWVLVNDMTIGQVANFYRVMGREARGTAARQFEELYRTSHKKSREITSNKIDSIYSRIKNFRNICAHDERLYCARPFGANNSLAQLMRDLELVLTKQKHREFLQQVESLMMRLKGDLPEHASRIFKDMGIDSLEQFRSYMESIRKN